MQTGNTVANRTLERLLALPDGDLRNCLGIAKEYADHPDINGKPSFAAGSRLMKQLELALDETEAMLGARG